MSSPEMLQEKAGSPMEPAHVNPELRPDVSSQRPEKHLGPTKTRETVLIPIDDLMDPPWNPRDIEDEGEMEKLVAFMANGGDIPPLMVWKGEGRAPWNVISGKRRRKAARLLGWTQMEVLFMDISLEEAMAQAIASNRDSKPYWLDEAIAIENLRNRTNWTRTMMAGKLGYSDSLIGQRLMLAEVLNRDSRDFIKRSIKSRSSVENTVEFHGVENSTAIFGGGVQEGRTAVKRAKPWQLTEDAAEPLMGFLDNRNKEEAKTLAFQALGVLIPGQYTQAQVEGLVQHMIDGKDLAQFQPPARGKKGRPKTSSRVTVGSSQEGQRIQEKSKDPNQPAASQPETTIDQAEVHEATPIGEEIPIHGHAHQKPEEVPYKTEVAASRTDAYAASAPRNDGGSNSGNKGVSLFWEWLADISLFKQVQQKVKSGQKLVWWEEIFLVLHQAAKGLALAGKDGAKPVLQALWKYGKKFAHGFFKLIHGLFKGTADLVAPLPHSSHSSGKHGTRSMTGLSPQALLQVVLHWTVYSLCWLVLGEFLGSRVPSLKPWVEFPFRYMAYLLFREFPAWALAQAPQHLVAALFAAALLAVGLFWGFSKDAVRMTLLIILLGAGWFYGRGWGTATPPGPLEPPTAVSRPPAETHALLVPVQGTEFTTSQTGTGKAPSSPRKIEPTNPMIESPKVEKPLPVNKQAPPAPVLSSKPQNGAGQKRSPQPPAPQSQSYITSPNVTVPEALKDWVELDADRALKFAGTFYGTSYRNTNQWQDYFQDTLAKDYSETFLNDFFPTSRIEEMDGKRLTQSFQVSGPLELLAVDNRTAAFLVSGTLTTREDSDTSPSVSSPIPVSLIVGLRGDGKVYRVDPQR